MYEIGRICIKISGRDAGKYCVIVDKVDENYVLIDGDVRRKKCNIKHLEPTEKIIKIKKDVNSRDVKKILYDEGVKIEEKKRVIRKKNGRQS